jgi:hypothetical protein
MRHYLNIYIYGEKSFKQEISKILDHSNIVLKLEGYGNVEEIDSLELLKEAIQNNTEDIFLIDESKIIDKESINAKLKFLTPKDGIEKEFLQKYNIFDTQIDSSGSLGKQISRKVDRFLKAEEERQEEISNSLNKEIASCEGEQCVLIDQELNELLEYDNWDKESQNQEEKTTTIQSFEKEEGNEDLSDFNKLDFDKNDLRLDILSFDEIEYSKNSNNEELSKTINDIDEELAAIMDLDNQDTIGMPKDLNQQLPTTTKGEDVAHEFDELNKLNEEDLISALENIDFSKESLSQIKTNNQNKPQAYSPAPSNEISLNNLDINQLSALISKLLENKTLDISIKIRD